MTFKSNKFLALADQFFYSLSGLMLSLFYARYMSIDNYASFSIFLSILLFAHGLHRAAIVLPMLKSLSVAEINERIWAKRNIIFCAGIAALAIAANYAFEFTSGHHSDSASLLIGLGIFTFLLYEFYRRLFFSKESAQKAALMSLLFFVLNSFGIAANIFTFGASLRAGMIFYAASTAISLALFAFGKHPHHSSHTEDRYESREVLWNLAAFFPYSIYNNAMPLLLAGMNMNSIVAVFAATRLFFAPATTLVSAVDSVDKPKAARAFRVGLDELFASLKSTAFLLAGSVGLYAVLVMLFRDPLVAHSVGPKFSEFSYLLFFWMTAALIMAFGQPVETGLIILGKSKVLFVSRILAAAIALVVLVSTVSELGALAPVLSVACGWLVSVSLSGAYLIFFSRQAKQ